MKARKNVIIHKINNESTTSVNGSDLRFSFQYDAATDKLGCLDINGDFYPFDNGGGSSTDDATAYAKNIESGYTAYCRGEKIIGTATVERSLDKYGSSKTGEIDGLSVNSGKLCGITVGNYALFAGGESANARSNSNVDAYDSSLTKSTAADLSYVGNAGLSATIGDYALLSPQGQSVEAYDSTLTKSTVVGLGGAHFDGAATSNSNYAIFGFGVDGSGTSYSNAIAYNSTLTKSSVKITGGGRQYSKGTNFGEYAIFGPGSGGSSSGNITNYQMFNSSLTSSYIPGFGWYYYSATSIDEYALFCGGRSGSSVYKYVNYLNKQLTASLSNILPTAIFEAAATSLYNNAIIAGGIYYSSSTPYRSATAQYVDSSLTGHTLSSLYQRRAGLAGTSIGRYALFAGGWDGSSGSPTRYNVVDAYYMSGGSGGSQEYIGDLDIDTSDATAYMDNIEAGYIAYARNYRIVGCANVTHTLQKYTGSTDPLSQARYGLSAASIGDYALFAGGKIGGNPWYSVVVDAFSSSLSRSNPTGLYTARDNMSATSIGDYALFAGGWHLNVTSIIDSYNISLTRSNSVSLSQALYGTSATSIGNYALFAGGRGDSPDRVYTVDAINSSLVRSSAPTIIQASAFMGATSNTNFAIFAGGSGNSVTLKSVNAYNASLTKSNATDLSIAKYRMASTHIGIYALFGGGSVYDTSDYTNIVDTYNDSLTRTTNYLNTSCSKLAATTIGDYYALFGGGSQYNSSTYYYTYRNNINAFNSSMTRSIPTVLSLARDQLGAANVGDFAIFAGGDSGNYADTVDVYELA